MKHYIIVATAMAALVACKGEAGSEETAAKKEPTLMLQTEDQKASYAIGMKFGEGMGRDLKDELDIDATIDGTAKQGWLDIHMRPERRNAVKLLLFLDVGGSMDPFIKVTEELFSAATAEFKNLEFFYFHNCLYEGVWKDNKRRWQERTKTWDVLHKYGHDYKVVFVGDAAMSPYEITHPGGSVEHMNEEAGVTWMKRVTDTYPATVWLNPVPEKQWGYSQSTRMIRELMKDRMYPLTIDGLDDAMRELSRKQG